jgi:hypothetical protein
MVYNSLMVKRVVVKSKGGCNLPRGETNSPLQFASVDRLDRVW